MCKYFGYFLSVWALGLGTFYAYMLYDVINSVRGLAGPLGAFQSLLGPSAGLGGLGAGLGATTPSPGADLNQDIDDSMKAIYILINENMGDEQKRLQYLREFLPDTGLEEHHFKEMNAILDDFQFEKLKEYLDKLSTYMTENIKDEGVRKKALAKLEEFKSNTANIDESLERLAAHISSKEEL